MGDEEKRSDSKWWLTVLTAIIGVSAPITAAVYTSASKDKELAVAEREHEYKTLLEQRQQDYNMRMGFLDRAVDPARPPKDRQVVLRFLAKVSTDTAMREWATSELRDVEAELDAANKRIKELEQKAADRDADVSRLNGQLAKVQGMLPSAEEKKQIAELKEKLRVAESKRQETTAELGAARTVIKPSSSAAAWAAAPVLQKLALEFDPSRSCLFSFSALGSSQASCLKSLPLDAVTFTKGYAMWKASGRECSCVTKIED